MLLFTRNRLFYLICDDVSMVDFDLRINRETPVSHAHTCREID